MARREPLRGGNPLWYRDAIIYQLHVKAFADSDGDGMGDFRGLMGKLDYLQSLGITAIWILPFYPSPLRDDGYDIADYYSVNPSYNTLREFREFLRAAHARRIRVITELVLNHTSDQHPWFQRARRAKPGSAHRDYYVWSDNPDRYQGTRIIFQDFETSNWSWDPVAKAYYWHRFYSHQPDLNYDNPKVQAEMLRVIDYWLGMGVDGVRLDAVPYLFEREGTNCENLPETHAFLKKLRAHVDASFPNRMLLGEANQWPEDAIAYFGEGDECNMLFHFPLMPRMYMAIEMEDRFPVIDIIDQTPAIPEGCQWAIFLRNHDELTLEMVTDEERDYMYRIYAADPKARINLGIRRRLAPLMERDRRKIELMNALLFSLPGTPIIYYGDEIGMGDNYYLGDRNGVRTPMQWSPDRNAGFSGANPQRLYLPVIIDPEYHYEAVNVEIQERNPTSLLWWMRRTIAVRRRHRAFSSGTLEMLYPANHRVLAFLRRHEDEVILVVGNLSRFAQAVSLDLKEFAGISPADLFSRNRFPVIREIPYPLTLGPHDHFWFILSRAESPRLPEGELPRINLPGGLPWWEALQHTGGDTRLERATTDYLNRSGWFRGKARAIIGYALRDTVLLRTSDQVFPLFFLEVRYQNGAPETYLIPVAFLRGPGAKRVDAESPQAAIASLSVGDEAGILCDALHDREFRDALLALALGRRRLHGKRESLVVPLHGRGGHAEGMRETEHLISELVTGEEASSVILYGDRHVFKLYRTVEPGVNSEVELVRFLTEKSRYPNIVPFQASLELRHPGTEPCTIGLVQEYVKNQGNGWRLALHLLGQYFERILSRRGEIPPPPKRFSSLIDGSACTVPEPVANLIGGFYLEMAGLLGRRTAELHLALAAGGNDPAWKPEAYSTIYQRSVYQSMRNQARRTLQLLSQNRNLLPIDDQGPADRVLGAEKEILSWLAQIVGRRIGTMKIRIHGNFHLGKVLFTGKDFVILDFEGEPDRTLSERRIKRSPLRDVASMIRSFHAATLTALARHGNGRSGDVQLLEPWADACYYHVSCRYLAGYLERMGNSPLVPADRNDLATLLRSFLLDRALRDLGFALGNRPETASSPLKGIETVLREYGE
ncbi:trehalose synthase [Geobacter metallireducens RCH3]|uniref:Maltokinase n=1 Tax=Geobacter metallireducens (strain ATCC 53774 / DSM 7210 / GS-15) TaxID=269799 RepID=Q39PZ6_GEOMG|nr:maltose alpha-D-glucosyltransferase [Geobacter metallireducens]ABB33678.1 trehalose/maltose transglucosylase and maltokinase, putative [Geobacter metallireducens GS-15]EHP85374.1 trehalose synthase [Geobacter metallireducens RCH3]